MFDVLGCQGKSNRRGTRKLLYASGSMFRASALVSWERVEADGTRGHQYAQTIGSA